jgi:hypothetical protein
VAGRYARRYRPKLIIRIQYEKQRLAREITESRARVLAEVAKIREEAAAAPPLPLVRYWTPPPGLRSFTRSARRGPLGPVTVRV